MENEDESTVRSTRQKCSGRIRDEESFSDLIVYDVSYLSSEQKV